MHEGCNGRFDSGVQVVNKLRQMGFSAFAMPAPVQLTCAGCSGSFTMRTMEDRCETCGMVYGVTPCHAGDPESIQPAGVDF